MASAFVLFDVLGVRGWVFAVWRLWRRRRAQGSGIRIKRLRGRQIYEVWGLEFRV